MSQNGTEMSYHSHFERRMPGRQAGRQAGSRAARIELEKEKSMNGGWVCMFRLALLCLFDWFFLFD